MSGITISSPFKWVRSVSAFKDSSPDGSAYVMALFVHDIHPQGAPPRNRTVVFDIEGGKIRPGSIYLDGFEGPMVQQKFVVPVP
jgi:hypothetical protein